MAAHSSILARRIPWTEEPGGLQSMGLQRVGHNRSDFSHSKKVEGEGEYATDPTGCVSLDSLLHLSEPNFPQLFKCTPQPTRIPELFSPFKC